MDHKNDIKQRDNHQEKPPRKLSLMMLKLVYCFKRARGVLFAFGVALFSTALNILTYIAGETIHPLYVTLWISTTEIIFAIISLIIIRPALPQSAKTVGYLVLGSVFTGCGSMSLLLGIMIAEPAEVVCMFFIMPVIVVILEAIIDKKKTKLLHLLFTVCSITGVVFVTQPSFLFNQTSAVNIWGLMLGLLSGFLHAGGLITMRKLAGSHIHPMILCTGTSITIWTISFISSFFNNGVAFSSEVEVLLVLLASGMSHFGACIFVYLALTTERAFIVSIIMTFEITFTFVVQWLILNLIPSWYSAIGGFLITVACIGVTLSKDEEDSYNNEGGNDEEDRAIHNDNGYDDDYHNNAGEEELLLHE